MLAVLRPTAQSDATRRSAQGAGDAPAGPFGAGWGDRGVKLASWAEQEPAALEGNPAGSALPGATTFTDVGSTTGAAVQPDPTAGLGVGDIAAFAGFVASTGPTWRRRREAARSRKAAA